MNKKEQINKGKPVSKMPPKREFGVKKPSPFGAKRIFGKPKG